MVSDCVDIHMTSGLHSPSLTGETISTHARSNHDSCESENSTCLHFFFFCQGVCVTISLTRCINDFLLLAMCAGS
jgi:hypothetical protein